MNQCPTLCFGELEFLGEVLEESGLAENVMLTPRPQWNGSPARMRCRPRRLSDSWNWFAPLPVKAPGGGRPLILLLTSRDVVHDVAKPHLRRLQPHPSPLH